MDLSKPLGNRTLDPESLRDLVQGRFVDAMGAVQRSRQRTGAQRWRLYRDGQDPRKFRETFTVASWTEHLRQHEDRLTGTDRDIVDAAKHLAAGEPVVEHLFPARTPVLREGS